MDTLVRYLIEEVALEGASGCTVQYLWQLLQHRHATLICSLYTNRTSTDAALDRWKTDTALQQYVLRQVSFYEEDVYFRVPVTAPTAVSMNAEENGAADESPLMTLLDGETFRQNMSFFFTSLDQLFITATDSKRHSVLLGDFSGSLTPRFHRCLELIAQGREHGLLQTELSRIMGIEPKNIFYVIKALEQYGLIQRRPVVADRSSTHLLLLPRFLVADQQHHYKTPRQAIIQLAVKRLKQAKDQTMFIQDLKGYLESQIEQEWQWKGLVWDMEHAGWIERFEVEVQVDQDKLKRMPCVKLKVSENDANLSQVQPSIQLTPISISAELRFQSLNYQIYKIIENAGTKGVTFADIRQCIPFHHRTLYRYFQSYFLTRRSPYRIVKKVQQSGKERSYVFVAASATAQPTPATSPERVKNKTKPTTNTNAISQVLTHLLSKAPESEVALQRRQQLLDLIQREGVVALTAPFIKRFTEMYPQSGPFTMDRRTLGRVAAKLEELGQIRVEKVALPQSLFTSQQAQAKSCLLVMDPSVKENDERIQSCIQAQVRESITVNSTPIVKQIQVESVMVHSTANTANASIQNFDMKWKKVAESYGFVQPLMIRVRLFHLKLFSLKCIKLVSTLVQECTLNEFLLLVGYFAPQRNSLLDDILANLGNESIMNLSEEMKQILNLKRIKPVVKKFICILLELGLIQVKKGDDNVTLQQLEASPSLFLHCSIECLVQVPHPEFKDSILSLNSETDLLLYYATLQRTADGLAFAVSSTLQNYLQRDISWQSNQKESLTVDQKRVLIMACQSGQAQDVTWQSRMSEKLGISLVQLKKFCTRQWMRMARNVMRKESRKSRMKERELAELQEGTETSEDSPHSTNSSSSSSSEEEEEIPSKKQTKILRNRSKWSAEEDHLLVYAMVWRSLLPELSWRDIQITLFPARTVVMCRLRSQKLNATFSLISLQQQWKSLMEHQVNEFLPVDQLKKWFELYLEKKVLLSTSTHQFSYLPTLKWAQCEQGKYKLISVHEQQQQNLDWNVSGKQVRNQLFSLPYKLDAMKHEENTPFDEFLFVEALVTKMRCLLQQSNESVLDSVTLLCHFKCDGANAKMEKALTRLRSLNPETVTGNVSWFSRIHHASAKTVDDFDVNAVFHKENLDSRKMMLLVDAWARGDVQLVPLMEQQWNENSLQMPLGKVTVQGHLTRWMPSTKIELLQKGTLCSDPLFMEVASTGIYGMKMQEKYQSLVDCGKLFCLTPDWVLACTESVLSFWCIAIRNENQDISTFYLPRCWMTASQQIDLSLYQSLCYRVQEKLMRSGCVEESQLRLECSLTVLELNDIMNDLKNNQRVALQIVSNTRFWQW